MSQPDRRSTLKKSLLDDESGGGGNAEMKSSMKSTKSVRVTGDAEVGFGPGDNKEPNKMGMLESAQAVEDAKASSMKKAAYLLIVFQLLMIILYAGCELQPKNEVEHNKDFATGYSMYSGIMIMMIIGFGYLMCFMDTCGMSALGFTFLATMVIFELSLVSNNWFERWFDSDYAIQDGGFKVSIYTCIDACFCVAAVLISFCGVIGKISLYQVLVMCLVETVVYSFNASALDTWFHVVDPGGTIVIHMFGAYFGLACAWMIGTPNVEQKESIYADAFAFDPTISSIIEGDAGAAKPVEPSLSLEDDMALTSAA